jgi:uncharacterized membrane protein YkvA (DUF1232 family)
MSTHTSPPSPPARTSIQSMMDNGQLVWRLLQDTRVPTVLKVAIPLAVAVYFLSPLDLIPDFIPVLGQLDDLGVILLGMTVLINLAPRDVVNEHRVGLGLDPLPPKGGAGPQGGATVIDADYRAQDRG